MSRINDIQNAIKQLEGGAFHKMIDDYIYKKWNYNNIGSYGIQPGTNKSIKGVPDSYVLHSDGTYTLLMYGTSSDSVKKIEKDIADALNPDKLPLERSKIREIILFHTQFRLSIPDAEQIRSLDQKVKIKLIGLDTLAQDLNHRFGSIAKDHLKIPINTEQILEFNEFIQAYDSNQVAAPLNIEFQVREKELGELSERITRNRAVLITGKSGIGKTKLVLEVLRSFRTKGFTPLVVKNNGLPLYEDFKMEINQTDNYILVFDDVNQTSDIEAVLSDLSTSYPKVKVVATVRDYQKGKFKERFSHFDGFEEYALKEFNNDDLREILKESLEINNRDLQDIIIKIAKGNVRLAVLAAKLARKELDTIESVTGIFQAHFNPIIEKNTLTPEDIKTLFTIAFFNKVPLNVDDEANKMLIELKLDDSKFKDSIHKLRTKELIDFYLDIATISDQSFRDYILEYVLLHQKSIQLTSIIDLFFDQSRESVVYVIRTLLSLFSSDDNQKYIIESVNESWENAPENLQVAYLKSFFRLNEHKSLKIIKNQLDKDETTNFKITDDVFAKSENSNQISNVELEILSGFNDSSIRNTAIQLLIAFLKKRPDLFMDVYSAIKRFIYSGQNIYKDDYDLVKQLMKSRIHDSWNLDYLLIKIIKELLKVTTEKVQANDFKTFTFITFSVRLTPDNEELRSIIWESLSTLYHVMEYRPYIHKILLEIDWRTRDGMELSIMQYDFNCIIQNFAKHWKNIDLEQMIVLDRLWSKGEEHDLVVDSRFEKFRDHSDYEYYSALTILSRRDLFLDDEGTTTEKIKEIIDDYELDDFEKVFDLAARLVKLKDDREKYPLGVSLSLMIESSTQSILELLELYFKHGAPFDSEVSSVVSRLDDENRQNIYKILQNYQFEGKNNWLLAVWEATLANDVTEGLASEFVGYVKSQSGYEHPLLPSIDTILRFKNYVPKILEFVMEQAVVLSESHPYIAHSFLLRYRHDASEVVALFVDSIELLETLYLNGMETSLFDYNGDMLLELLKYDESFWEKYVQKLNHNADVQNNSHDVFSKIWLLDNYDDMITSAFNILVLDTQKYVSYEPYETIFATTNLTSANRRTNWIIEYIKTHINDDTQIKSLFHNYISIQSDEDKIRYWEEFLSERDDISIFKKMALLPTQLGWTGSEVPIVDRNIQFVKKLMELPLLEDINYIEHQEYLTQLIDRLATERKRVQIREFERGIL